MSILKPKKEGKTGIKRTMGFIMIVVSIALAIIDQFSEYKVNISVWGTMFGAGTALIGVSAFPKLNS